MLSFIVVCGFVLLFLALLGVFSDSSPSPTPAPPRALPPVPAPAPKPTLTVPRVPVRQPAPQRRVVTPPKPAPIPTPTPARVPAVPPIPPSASSEHELEVSKALTQLERWAEPLGRELWTGHNRRADWQHDLTIMRQRRDLEYVRLELLDARNTVLHAFELKFDQQRVSPQSIMDAARGVEIPILTAVERQRIASHRLLVNSSQQRASFQRLLKMNWTTADTLTSTEQRGFESQHARKITGGRLSGEVRVAKSAMQTLVITRSGSQGFAFARSLDEPTLTNVFLHTLEAPKGVTFVPGQRVRALVIQTPNGPQGRGIQLAT
ncbi:MAG: hypothetical protein ACKV2Q_32905 [Planctomycetaceae bacterium]